MNQTLRACSLLFLITTLLVSQFAHAVLIASGDYQSFFASNAGNLKAWGWNGNGQLGDNTTTDKYQRVDINTIKNIDDVSGGYYHTLAATLDGQVYAWGSNAKGQLGDGSAIDHLKPVLLSTLNNVKHVSAGYAHSIALLNDGTVKVWGANDHGQLGLGDTQDRITPTLIKGLNNVRWIEAGKNHTVATLNDGTVIAWGANASGQLGDGTFTDRMTPTVVAALSNASLAYAGDQHSVALLADGTLKAWGSNQYGQLGNGTKKDSSTPVAVTGIKEATRLAAGGWHNLILLKNGTLMAWGANANGQLGDGSKTDRPKPVAIKTLSGVVRISAGYTHSMSLQLPEQVSVWGGNAFGQLGNGTTTDITKAGSKPASSAVVAAAPATTALASYAGRYTGTYAGDDSGSVQVEMASNGKITGSGQSSIETDYSFKVTGSVVAGGEVNLKNTGKAGSASFTGTVSAQGQLQGKWTGSNGISGTFSLSRIPTQGVTNPTDRPVAIATSSLGSATATDGSSANPLLQPTIASITPAVVNTDEESVFTVEGSNLPNDLVLTVVTAGSTFEWTANLESSTAVKSLFSFIFASYTGTAELRVKTKAGQLLKTLQILVKSKSASGSTTNPTTGTNSTTVKGRVAIAPISYAVMSAYQLNGCALGDMVTLGYSDSGLFSEEGAYSLDIGSVTTALVIEASGGDYIDPATGSSKTQNQNLHAIIPAGNTLSSVNVTPYTELAYRNYLKGKDCTDQGIKAANTAIKNQLGFDPVSTKPLDPSQALPADATLDQMSYAAALGTIAQLMADNAETTPSSVYDTLSAAFDQGTFNTNSLVVEAANNFGANPNNLYGVVMGNYSTISGANMKIPCALPGRDCTGKLPPCPITPKALCHAPKVVRNNVCVLISSASGSGSTGGSGSGSSGSGSGSTNSDPSLPGSDASQCIKVYQDSKIRTDSWIMKNTCSYRVVVEWCHGPSKIGGKSSECNYNGFYYHQRTWLESGETHDNALNQPIDATLKWGACVGGIKQTTNGSYMCVQSGGD